MGDQWYYNYNSVNYPPLTTQDQNSQVPPVNTPVQYVQWQQQSQSNQAIPGAPFVPYPPVPSYPPPVGVPYSSLPPSIPAHSNFGYYNYNSQLDQQNQVYGARPPPPPPNDYTRELETYKYIKAKISEESIEFGRGRERFVENYVFLLVKIKI